MHFLKPNVMRKGNAIMTQQHCDDEWRPTKRKENERKLALSFRTTKKKKKTIQVTKSNYLI